MNTIDLRSDTVTKPTPEMWEAMARADVGDDVYGEDPSVNLLQEIAADMLGKEAGLFVPSGTMGNLASFLAHCGRGDEAILGDISHTFLYEAGGIAALGGIHPRTIPNQPNGNLALDDIRAAVRSENEHFPVTRLISLENTHNRCRGAALTPDYCQQVGEIAKENGLVLHLDGARLFNAAAALDVSPAEIVEPFDSLTFCLSKGLSAPVGSVICGTKDFIHKAFRARKQLGGGMRQAGVVAAAGIVALKNVVPLLKKDHERAGLLASKLAEVPGIELDGGMPQTNMVYIFLEEDAPLTGEELVKKLNAFGVKIGQVGPRRFRLVTHFWIDNEAVKDAVEAFEAVLAAV